MLVDANILLYAVDTTSPFHLRSRDWLEDAINGDRLVGLPWQSLHAFLRIATNPRALTAPLEPTDAWQIVETWLDAPSVWVPEPGPSHRSILGQLISDHRPTANLLSDVALAALCLEHGLPIVSADSDFARFPSVTWINPVV